MASEAGVMREIHPHSLLNLYDDLEWVRRNYPLGVKEKNKLKAAADVLWGLKQSGRVVLDPDVTMPLLAKENGHTDEDKREIASALAVLALSTGTLGLYHELAKLDPYGEFGSIAGWRWYRAAMVITSGRCTADQMQSWRYYAAIARRFNELDRHKPLPVDAPALSVEEIADILGGG
jgi:hypothetical protein